MVRSRAEILATHDWRRYNAKTPETKCRCDLCKADWSRHCSEYARSSPAVKKRRAENARIQNRRATERQRQARRAAEREALLLASQLEAVCRAQEAEPEVEILSPSNRRAAVVRIEVVFPF